MSEPAPAPPPPAPDHSLWRNPSFLVAVGLWSLRALYAAFPNLFPEEAYYWSYAKHLDYGYLDHPPMVAWLIALGTALFGDTAFGVRVFALGSSVVTSVFVFRLTALLYDRRAACVAFLAVQVLPFFFLAGLVMTPDVPLTACWSAMLYFLTCALFRRRPLAWLGVGVSLGLGMLSKYTIALLGPATLLFVVLDAPSRFWFRQAAPYLAVALSLVLFSPVIWWNAAHHWASFAFQTTGRIRVRRHFALHELAGTVVGALSPVGVWLAGLALTSLPAASAAPGLHPDLTADLPRRRRLFTRVFTLVPFAVFVFFSLTHRVKLNWTGPLWLAMIPALAAQLTSTPRLAGFGASRYLRPAWIATVAVCGLLYILTLQHLSFGVPGLRYSANTEILPVGWTDLARDVERLKSDLERTTHGPVYVVGMDRNFIASELAFYQSDRQRSLRETTGAHLFEGGSLMYQYWSPAARFEGATLLLVGFRKSELNSRRVRDHSASSTPVETHTLTHQGKKVRPFYTRVAYGYHSADLPSTP